MKRMLLRQNLFFDEFEIEHYDSDCEEIFIEHNIFINANYNIYKKKYNININFSGIQNIYNKFGRIYASFYHVNGIKEGEYKIFFAWNRIFILNFANDIQIGDMITIKCD